MTDKERFAKETGWIIGTVYDDPGPGVNLLIKQNFRFWQAKCKAEVLAIDNICLCEVVEKQRRVIAEVKALLRSDLDLKDANNPDPNAVYSVVRESGYSKMVRHERAEYAAWKMLADAEDRSGI
jgi:hypothetical protein